MSPSPRILIVSDTLHAGGAETFCLRLAQGLNGMDVPTDILSLNPDLEDAALIAQYPGVTVHRIRLPLLRWIKRLDRVLKLAGIDASLQYFLTRRAFGRRYAGVYDLFHTHLFPVDYMVALAKRHRPALRILSTLHGDYDEYEDAWQKGLPKRKLHWPRKRALTGELVDQWVYISPNQYALFRERYGVPDEQLEKVYNGYQPPAALPPRRPKNPADGLTFIMVARGIREKGWEYLVAAFRNIAGPHRLVLVGKGAFLEELQRQYGGDERITFAGFHPNPAALIAAADVFVFPSVYKAESLPTVIIEALYCGIPVISTRIGEVAEMLTDPESGGPAGILIDRDDEARIATDLQAAMERYIGDPALYRAHAGRAKAAFSQFRMDECCRKYISLYRKVLE